MVLTLMHSRNVLSSMEGSLERVWHIDDIQYQLKTQERRRNILTINPLTCEISLVTESWEDLHLTMVLRLEARLILKKEEEEEQARLYL